MKCGEIRDICGDYALDIQYPKETITLYFNSLQNALNVKKIIEIDDSIPNMSTVCDMQEVVRCKDCVNFQKRSNNGNIGIGSHCKRVDSVTVHGYRDGEPSVDETLLWMNENGFCSYGKRRKNDE